MKNRSANVPAFCLAVFFVVAVQLTAAVTPSATCQFSQSLSASPTSVIVGGTFDLTWCDPSTFIPDNSFSVGSYSVYYSKSPQGPWLLVRQVAPPTTSVRLTTDSTDVPVIYLYVKAVGCTSTIVGGCPPNPLTEIQSNIVSVTVGGSAACQFQRSLSISPSIVPVGQPFILRWCDPSFAAPGGSLTIDFFRVLTAPSASGPWETFGDVAAKTAVELAPTGGDEGSIYFKVEAWGCGGGTTASAVCAPATKQLESNVVVLTVTEIFTASPSSIAAGQSTTLLWSAPANSSVTISPNVGSKPSSGAATVSPPQTTTYTLTAVSGQSTITVQTTVEVIAQPLVVVSSFPRGLTQTAGAGGGTDRIVLANIGGSATTVNVTPVGGFFTASPGTISIDRGSSATAMLQGTPQPAGVQSGSVTFAGNGVPAGLSVPVRLLSAAPAAGMVVPRALQSRVDISSAGSGMVAGSATFRNDGTASLQGIAVSDAAWLQPESGIITIAPNQSRAVSFTIDPTRRSDALPASESATLKLVAAPGQSSPGSSAVTEDAAGKTEASASIEHTSRTTVSQVAVPSFVSGELGYFLPAMPHSSTLIADLLALNRPNNEKRVDLSLYYLGAGASSALGRLASFPSIAPSSLIRLADIVKALFNEDGRFSTVQVRSKQIDKLSVSANLLQTGDARGLFGSPLPAIRSDRAVMKSALPGVRKTSTANTSIYVQEASGAPARVRTDFLDEAGATIASRTDDIGAFALLEETNVVPDRTASAVVSVLSGGGIIARALMTDSSSGDVTDILDWAARNAIGVGEAQFVPYVRKGQTASGSVSTEMVVFNAGSTPLSGTISYRPATISGGNGRRRAVGHTSTGPLEEATVLSPKSELAVAPDSVEVLVTLAPQHSKTFPDVLADLGAGSDATGYLIFTPTAGQASITARVNTTASGTFSAAVPLAGPTQLLRNSQSVYFSGLEDAGPQSVERKQAGTFRAALSLTQADGTSAKVRVTVHFTSGISAGRTVQRALVTKVYELTPDKPLVITNLMRDVIGPARDTLDDLHNVQVDLIVFDGDGGVIPLIISTENATGDMFMRAE
ncbi:MAG: hypothetical protein ACXVIJ_02265 [Thermoanaerobaculia bacterium]